MLHSGNLSRQERQVMEIIYRKARASVGDIRAEMPQPASYSAVRVIVNVLERKGHLRHVKVGKKYVYSPRTPRSRAAEGALRHLLNTYFGGSLHQAVAAMVQLNAKDISDDDMRQLIDSIEGSKKGNPP